MVAYKSYYNRSKEKTSFFVFLKYYESNHWSVYAECFSYDEASYKALRILEGDKTVESVKVTEVVTSYNGINGIIKEEVINNERKRII